MQPYIHHYIYIFSAIYSDPVFNFDVAELPLLGFFGFHFFLFHHAVGRSSQGLDRQFGGEGDSDGDALGFGYEQRDLFQFHLGHARLQS